MVQRERYCRKIMHSKQIISDRIHWALIKDKKYEDSSSGLDDFSAG